MHRGNIGALIDLAMRGERRLELILVVPARRYAELVETSQARTSDDAGPVEANFAGHRLIVDHVPLRAEGQTSRRRARIAELAAMAQTMVVKLAGQDAGKTVRRRRAYDRGVPSRFVSAVAEAERTRISDPTCSPTASPVRRTRRPSPMRNSSMAGSR